MTTHIYEKSIKLVRIGRYYKLLIEKRWRNSPIRANVFFLDFLNNCGHFELSKNSIERVISKAEMLTVWTPSLQLTGTLISKNIKLIIIISINIIIIYYFMRECERKIMLVSFQIHLNFKTCLIIFCQKKSSIDNQIWLIMFLHV